MPGLSGWETLQRLRNNPITANIPVVVLSVLSSTLRPQLTGDAQGWVQKPFNENLLFAELGRVLHHGEGPAYVLLVEDDEDLASVLTASFQDAAVYIDHASSRQQAIRQCITRPPDLLILDLTLPDGDGFSLVEWLRQQPTLRTLPLVVYSGREISESEMAKLRLGPTEFLTKAKVQPAGGRRARPLHGPPHPHQSSPTSPPRAQPPDSSRGRNQQVTSLTVASHERISSLMRRILIIDDEDDIREVAALSLEATAGWEILTASSGAEGISIAAAEQPDAILMDVMMPGVDGPTTFSAMQQNPAIANIPVLLLTAKVQGVDQRRFAGLGLAGILFKPFDPLTLAEQISEVLGWKD